MIRSTFAGFATAYSGLMASQKALDVTGQNMSNVNTEGYTRQRLDLYSRASGGYASLYANGVRDKVGGGVIIGGVSQIRDKFLDVRFRSEMCGMGETAAKLGALEDLGRIFDKIAVEGLDSQMNDFINKLHELSKYPDSVEFDAMLRSSAEVLVTLFNQYAKQINDVSDEQKYLLKDIGIPDVNGILENIASLNKSIKADQLAGNPSLELMDKRNLLLDELSQYMNIDVVYTPSKLSSGLTIEDVEVRLVTPGTPSTYTTLVDNANAFKLRYEEDADGYAGILMDGTGSDITGLITTGSLKGLLDMVNCAGELDTPPSDVRGVRYYTGAMDLLVSKFAEAFNEANKYLNPLYDPNNPGAAAQYLDRPLFVSNDGAPITASNIRIAPEWLDGDYGVTVTKKDLPPDSDGANDNILNMIQLFSKQFDFSVGKGTFQSFFSQIGTTLDIDTNATAKLLDNHDVTISGIYDLRESISSVNLDEEGINLLRYQKSYNAAARLMTTLDEALNTIINNMGIVGR